MYRGVFIAIWYIVAAGLLATGHGTVVGVAVLGLWVGIALLWLAVKAWVSVRQ